MDPLLNTIPRSKVTQAPLAYRPARPSARPADDLFHQHSSLISSLIRKLTDDPETRKDLTGEAYLLFRKLVEGYDPARGIPFEPYLFSQLKMHLYSRCRSHRGIQRREMCMSEVDTLANPAPDPTESWDWALEMRRWMGVLPDLLAGVPDRQRRVIIWRYIEGASFDEISLRLGVRPATARSLLRHGLNRLRILAAQLEGA